MTWMRRPTRIRAETATGPRAPRTTRPMITRLRPSFDVRSVETRRPGRALTTPATVPWALVPPAGGAGATTPAGAAGARSIAWGGATTAGAAPPAPPPAARPPPAPAPGAGPPTTGAPGGPL